MLTKFSLECHSTDQMEGDGFSRVSHRLRLGGKRLIPARARYNSPDLSLMDKAGVRMQNQRARISAAQGRIAKLFD